MNETEIAAFGHVSVIETAGGHLAWRWGSGQTVEILDIVVTERRVGHGRRLVQMLVDLLATPAAVWAFTRKGNGIARDFYRGIGFQEAAVLPGFYQDGDAAVLVCMESTRSKNHENDH